MRVSYNLSLEELAEIMGISPAFAGLIERGQRGVKLDRLITICEFFHVSFDYLMFGKNAHNTPEKIADNPVLALENVLSEYELGKLCDFGRKLSLHRFTENETDSLFNALHDLVLLMKSNSHRA